MLWPIMYMGLETKGFNFFTPCLNWGVEWVVLATFAACSFILYCCVASKVYDDGFTWAGIESNTVNGKVTSNPWVVVTSLLDIPPDAFMALSNWKPRVGENGCWCPEDSSNATRAQPLLQQAWVCGYWRVKGRKIRRPAKNISKQPHLRLQSAVKKPCSYLVWKWQGGWLAR